MSQWQNINPGDEIPKEALPLNANNLNKIEEKLSNTVQKSGTDTPMKKPLKLRSLVEQDEYGTTHMIGIDENEAVSKEYIEAYWDDFFANTYDHTWRDFSESLSWHDDSGYEDPSTDSLDGYYHRTYKVDIKGKFNYFIFYEDSDRNRVNGATITSPSGKKREGFCIGNITNEWQSVGYIRTMYGTEISDKYWVFYKKEDDSLLITFGTLNKSGSKTIYCAVI